MSSEYPKSTLFQFKTISVQFLLLGSKSLGLMLALAKHYLLFYGTFFSSAVQAQEQASPTLFQAAFVLEQQS